jgi:hypothetical protein
MRFGSGLEIWLRSFSTSGGVQRQARRWSERQPQGHGFVAVSSMNSASSIVIWSARLNETSLSFRGWLRAPIDSEKSGNTMRAMRRLKQIVSRLDNAWLEP